MEHHKGLPMPGVGTARMYSCFSYTALLLVCIRLSLLPQSSPFLLFLLILQLKCFSSPAEDAKRKLSCPLVSQLEQQVGIVPAGAARSLPASHGRLASGMLSTWKRAAKPTISINHQSTQSNGAHTWNHARFLADFRRNCWCT